MRETSEDGFSLDLKDFSMTDFKQMLKSMKLLPGRRILLEEIDARFALLKKEGVCTLSDLLEKIQKRSLSELSVKTNIPGEYLTVLRREAASYISKPIDIKRVEGISKETQKKLLRGGFSTTKQLYLACLKKSCRKVLCSKLDIELSEIEKAVVQADLLRINGVGPVFSRLLADAGIRNSRHLAEMNSKKLVEQVNKTNEVGHYTKAKLGVSDMEYCQRFAAKLPQSVEW